MPNELYPDSDPSPSPRVEVWVRGRLQREFPGLPEQVIASAIRNAAALVHPRKSRGVILSVARSCLPEEEPRFSAAPECLMPADASLVGLLQRCLPVWEDPPDADRFNREIFARLLSSGDEGG